MGEGRWPRGLARGGEKKEEVHRAALEFMREVRPSMVCRQDSWVPTLVHECLEGMGKFPDDPTCQ
jgi:hypothetical protein